MVPYQSQFRFRRKDFLGPGDPDKLITGSEIMAEFRAIARALNSNTPGTYTILTNFAIKDSEAHLDPDKIVDGYELEAEFEAVRTAISALGGVYTRVYDFETLHDTDAEILGLHFEAEFNAIQSAVDAVYQVSTSFNIITEDAEFFYFETEDGDLMVTEGS